MQHSLGALALHRGIPAIKSRALEQEVHDGTQAHPMSWGIDFGRFLRGFPHARPSRYARKRKVHA